MRYEAVFTMEEMTGKQSEIKEENKPVENEQVATKQGISTKTISKVTTTAIATTLVAANMFNTYQQASLSISGDEIQSQQLTNKMAYLNEGLGIAGAVGVGALTGTLPLVAVGLAVKYSMQSYQTSQANRVKQATWQIDALTNSEKQKRLVQDKTGVRI